jgi:hypothetical protein
VQQLLYGTPPLEISSHKFIQVHILTNYLPEKLNIIESISGPLLQEQFLFIEKYILAA